ncbi:MAG TPA: PhnD/SsuA/transferrin family substrate-binding protein [Xanthobacteraceae bacterium]|nr:PhnD/SsuA/transferrin family substrate-binding protein [Xanthobacteraceae bacterium]
MRKLRRHRRNLLMPNLKLTLACWDYDRTRPLMDGRVKPEGIDLDIEILRPRQAFQRMLDKREFQVCELSLASYTALKGRGECPFVAVPVALSKIFRHSCIYVRSGAGIRTPQDLKGKRVGTSQWSSTGLVFMRGMLQHDYGIKAQDMHWFMGGLNSFVERPLIPLDLPKDIKLDFLSGQQTLEAMFAAGELDALLSLYIPKLFLERSSNITRLFPNYKEAEQDYYRRTRIFPIMHTVVLREDIYRDHPWAARNIYQAFVRARDLAVDGLYDTDALRVALPWLIDHVEEAWRIFGDDFWAYGLERNRPTFEAVGRYVHEQGLSPRVVSADELFAAVVE